MKKLLVLVLLVVAVWLGINYFQTGRLTFFPKAANPAEQHLSDLERQLDDVNGQLNAAGRTAGMTGMDTTADVGALMAQKERLEQEIARAKQDLGR